MEKQNRSWRNQGREWWRYGYVWMVLSGPLLVAIASFVSLWLALRTPDPQVDMAATARVGAIDAQALAPAVKARNHAATGVLAPKP
jgi:hypothetical protein